MNYVSWEFLVFLAATIIVYFAAPKKVKWCVLLIASYVFYLFSGLDNLVFMLTSTCVTFFGGLWLGKLHGEEKAAVFEGEDAAAQKKAYKAAMKKKRNRAAALILVINLGILVFLKYYNFAASTIDTLLGMAGLRKFVPEFDLLLPLGISFYTFQSSGYVIDVCKGKYEPDRNLFKFALFVSFFPQIVQGPIGRYDDLAHQLYEPHKPEYRRCKFGFQLLIWGYFQKLVIADRMMLLCINVFDNYTQYAGFEFIVASLIYGVQLYCDFAGGVNVCRGAAQILGITMAENFEQPFFATTLSDFWRRWHMSLGNWMKDYLFYPLAMSKPVKKMARKASQKHGLAFGALVPNCIPSLVVFFIIGIWHGASWAYVAFGLYNGGLIALSVLLTPVFAKMNTALKINTERFSWRVWQMVRTLILITISRILVRPEGLTEAVYILKSIFTTFNPWILFDGSLFEMGLDKLNFGVAAVSTLVLTIVGVLHENGWHLREKLDEQGLLFRWFIMMCAILSVLILGSYGPAFVATEFIYQAF